MRLLFAGLGVSALIWVGGLIWFITALPTEPAERTSVVDGVVVLTGRGGDRIPTGMALANRGVGDRLLISGVNPNISRASIAELWPGRSETFACCVDLGLEAKTTKGNAIEVRDWVDQHKFDRLILVTSDYHMPRAMLEIRNTLPNAKVFPYPAQSIYLDESGWPSSLDAWRIIAVEYSKFLAVRLQTIFR